MRFSVHVDNKKKDILILGEGPTQGLGGTTLTAEKMYSVNFILTGKNFAYITMEQIVIYLLMVQKLLNLKQKVLKL